MTMSVTTQKNRMRSAYFLMYTEGNATISEQSHTDTNSKLKALTLPSQRHVRVNPWGSQSHNQCGEQEDPTQDVTQGNWT